MNTKKSKLLIIAMLYSIITLYILLSYNIVFAKEAVATFVTYTGQLSPAQLAVYDQIYAHANAYDDSMFTLEQHLTEDDFELAINYFFYENPELYWLDTSYKYALNASNVVVKLQLNYLISPDDIKSCDALFESKLNAIITQAAALDTPIEQERFIHDYICSNTSYDENAPMNQSAFSALTSPTTVCAGYARAFQIACNRLSIPCYYVTGTSKGINHAWNIVYIDGKYYNVDITWDDVISESQNKPAYDYFNKSDAEFALDHTRSSHSMFLPTCD